MLHTKTIKLITLGKIAPLLFRVVRKHLNAPKWSAQSKLSRNPVKVRGDVLLSLNTGKAVTVERIRALWW